MIGGQISDEYNNNLSGVNVSLLYLNNDTFINDTTTNGSGRFSFNMGVLPPGNYIYRLNASDNDTHNGEITTINVTVPKFDSSLNLNADNITYGDNTNITATLTDNNGMVLSNKNITFNINGRDLMVLTNGSGVAVLSIFGVGVGVYNVSATFSGDDDYNPSFNNTSFSVRMNTSLNITKTVNSINVIVGDLVDYTIQVTNKGVNDISTPILVNDTLSSGLGYISSFGSVGSYNLSTGLWIIPGLNSGDTATLNIAAKVKNEGNVVNHAFLVLNDYNNNLTNDSSVNVTVNPSNGGDTDDGSGGNGGDTDDGSGGNGGDIDDGSGGNDGAGSGLLGTGFPLILLIVLSVFGLFYWRRK